MKFVPGSALLLSAAFASVLSAQVSIHHEAASWDLTNGHVHMQLAEKAGSVYVRSLRREGGREWVVADTPLIDSPETAASTYKYLDDATQPMKDGGQQLTLRFSSDSG